ncbi:class I SAM-dependent methyltransferase [Roseomonas sp. CAU 1739]|uniref:class I SAM-dependent methyltransferase n=1 Tax=Roseomonas sp. CAU 1739 TaxID=3140364 RepID=UPI00325BBF33
MSTTPGLGLKDVEREGWHRKAGHYDRFVGTLTRPTVQSLLDAVSAGSGTRLLDVCCGPGYVAEAAAARGADVAGLDIATAMVALAQARAPRARFRLGDAEALDLPDGSVDAVVCGFGLLHLPDPARAMAEAHRVLRPGGRYAFTVWDGPAGGDFMNLMMKALMAHGDMSLPIPAAPPFYLLADRAAATAMLRTAGFHGVAHETLPIAFRGDDAEDAWAWFEKGAVRGWMIFERQAPEVQARIRTEVLAGAARHAGPDGVTIPSPAVLYAATRPG